MFSLSRDVKIIVGTIKEDQSQVSGKKVSFFSHWSEVTFYWRVWF